MNRVLEDLIKDNAIVKEEQKNSEVVSLIRKKYSVNEEFKILRQAYAGTDNGEFAEYNTYVEECKKQVKTLGNLNKEA